MKPAPEPWRYRPDLERNTHVITDRHGETIAHLDCSHECSEINLRLIIESPNLKKELETGSKFLETIELETGVDTRSIRKTWRILIGRILGIFN